MHLNTSSSSRPRLDLIGTKSARRGAELGLALVLLLVGTWLRAHDFATYSLWLDEAWVGVSSEARTLHDFLLGISSTPVLLILTTRAAHAVFGNPEIGARFVPEAFSILALALAYRLGRDLQGTPGGTVAMALIAFQPTFVSYAKQVK